MISPKPHCTNGKTSTLQTNFSASYRPIWVHTKLPTPYERSSPSPHTMAPEDEIPLYTVDFTFRDLLGAELCGDANDFVTTVNFEVRTDPEGPGEEVEAVGKGMLSLVHFSLAIDAGFPLFEVADASSSIMAMCEALMSWEEGSEPFDELDGVFQEEPIFNRDICFVEWLEVLPAHRGHEIGRQVLEAIARRYYMSCGLVVLRGHPLQHVERVPDDLDAWAKAMRYDALEQDVERAQYQLFGWYQRLGLRKPFDGEYFIARPRELARLPVAGTTAQ